MSEEAEAPNACVVCGGAAEFVCERCNEPVCEDCATPFTMQNQIDYTQCSNCTEMGAISAREDAREWEDFEDALKEKKRLRKEKAKQRYWLPENVEKRRLKKIARDEMRREARIERYKEVKNIMSGFGF